MIPTANWSYPTAIKFGPGRIAELPAACAQAGITRPLLVTDRGLAALPITAATLDILDAAGLGRAIFAEVDPNPTEKNLDAGLAAYKAGGHDGVVAFGGGSGLDLGKMVAFMSGQTRPLWDFEDIGDWWTRADPGGHRADRGGADDRWHRLRGRARQRHHQFGNPCEEDHLPPQGPAHRGHRGPRTDRGDARLDHRRHRHGRLRPLPRGLLLARITTR